MRIPKTIRGSGVNSSDVQGVERSVEPTDAPKRQWQHQGVLLRRHPCGSPAAASGAAGTPVGWYMGRQWGICIAVPIRPTGPRVVSNAITPRPTANLVWPPLFVVLGLPVVAPDHTAQISHGPLTFKGSMAIPPISVPLSVHGRIWLSSAGERPHVGILSRFRLRLGSSRLGIRIGDRIKT